MFPRVTFDLPILSMDLVANGGRVSLAVIDPCPVSANLQLPAFYEGPVRQLQARVVAEAALRFACAACAVALASLLPSAHAPLRRAN